jgi:O-antigen ligase
VIRKTTLINTLFLLGIVASGVGSYFIPKQYSMGILLTVLPHLCILLIYAIDLLYRGRITPMVNRVYWLGMLFIVSLIASMWVALGKGFPGLSTVNVTAASIQFIVPFNAAIVLQVYNRNNPDFDLSKLLFNGLVLLMVVNFMGYAAGQSNRMHWFPGRINLPYTMGIYSTAHIVALLNLFLLFYIRDPIRRPGRFILMSTLFLMNMAVMLSANSRLSIMIFFLLLVLFLFRLIRAAKGLFAISLFTMPLMMSFSLLIYEIISLPFFANILGRVSKRDVTTFNGRTDIWEAAFDWVLHDRTGFILGNGYRGHYSMRMLDFVAVLWGEKDSFNLHMHSAFLEILMGQGIVGYLLYVALLWYAFSYYRREYQQRTDQAPLFAGIVYFLFIWQIDMFVYGIDQGNPLFFTMLSAVAIDRKFITRRPRALNGSFLE